MPEAFQARYTNAQRAALAHAYEDRRIRPAARVVDMAKRGELEHQGEPLEPFDTNANTVRNFARDLKRRRRGEKTSQLADVEPRDAVETLRRRLVNIADGELTAMEDQKAGTRDPERLRQIVRAVREIAALPGPKDPRPAAPGQRKDGHRDGGETKGGLAGTLLAEHRRSHGAAQPKAGDETAQNAAPHADQNGEGEGTGDREAQRSEHETDEESSEPGSRVRRLAAVHGVELAGRGSQGA